MGRVDMDSCQSKGLNFTQDRLRKALQRTNSATADGQKTAWANTKSGRKRARGSEEKGEKTVERERERGLFFCSIYRVMAVFPARSLVSSPMTGCHIISSPSQHLNCPMPQFSPSSLALHLVCDSLSWMGFITSQPTGNKCAQAWGLIIQLKLTVVLWTERNE